MKLKKLTINGRFLTQQITGVQRVAREFVMAFDNLLSCHALEGWEVEILLPRGSKIFCARTKACEYKIEKRWVVKRSFVGTVGFTYLFW